jgi:hypothetical protein
MPQILSSQNLEDAILKQEQTKNGIL